MFEFIGFDGNTYIVPSLPIIDGYDYYVIILKR